MAINKTSFTLGFLKPNQVSSQRLSPGSYSLSARSNIPFARLIGKGVDKIFTWGETVEVPPGMLCTVSNACFHAGDLFLNSGCDLDNRPAAITVPFLLGNQTVFADLAGYGSPYPVDVRMARKAYANVSLEKNGVGTGVVSVFGQRFDGSHNTFNELFASLGTGFQSNTSVPLNTSVGPVPLGKNIIYGTQTPLPHTLLTVAWAVFVISEEWVVIDNNAYYTVEY